MRKVSRSVSRSKAQNISQVYIITPFFTAIINTFFRFYFVSSSDLLDILSKGRDPRAIMRHIGKIFENVLTYEIEGPNIMSIKSKEGEFVKISRPIKTGGAVEDWLSDLLKGK